MAPQVGLEPTTTRLTAECSAIELLRNNGLQGVDLQSNLETGGGLLSRAVTHQVPSALKGLTSVFGMGTGDPLRHCHRKLWRSRGSGAQGAFHTPRRPSPWFLPSVARWASDRRVPCPRSSPDSHGGAVPGCGLVFRLFPRPAVPPPSVLLRAGRFRLRSVCSRSLPASAPPLATP